MIILISNLALRINNIEVFLIVEGLADDPPIKSFYNEKQLFLIFDVFYKSCGQDLMEMFTRFLHNFIDIVEFYVLVFNDKFFKVNVVIYHSQFAFLVFDYRMDNCCAKKVPSVDFYERYYQSVPKF